MTETADYIYSLQCGTIVPTNEKGEIGLPQGFDTYNEWREAEFEKRGLRVTHYSRFGPEVKSK